MNSAQAGKQPRAMVLGGYGLIGSACLRALAAEGYEMTGVGGDPDAIARMDLPAHWQPDADWPLTSGWVAWSQGLYVFVGLFWLPVIWIQKQTQQLTAKAAETGSTLPLRYHRLFAIWITCGVPAFLAALAIVWLMITKLVV